MFVFARESRDRLLLRTSSASLSSLHHWISLQRIEAVIIEAVIIEAVIAETRVNLLWDNTAVV